ncbi:MAG: hypothetical protein AUH81_11215 [Candidatus Rokubacteria bacterium 13_1_40CM_4_69_5]|nr:MAG: hypothetical protein AUH81_11215 [Candidatus Rokubacteria bacterium 13_1_40CM_4_69_5]
MYGVIVHAGAVDAAAAAERRRGLGAARIVASLAVRDDLDESQVRQIALDRSTADRLGVGPGDVVEVVTPRGAPLRAWVTAILPAGAGRAEVSPVALALLALGPGARVELRPLVLAGRPA